MQARTAASNGPGVVSWAAEVAESLFATLFPADCRICGEPLIRISRLPVCDVCLDSIHPIVGGLCTVCGERIVSVYVAHDPSGEIRCGLCRRVDPPYVRALAYGSYESGLRDLIHMLKYQRVRPAANVLGRMLAEVIAELEPAWAPQPVVVVPVPLFPRKLQVRGFNQAEVIARAALKLAPVQGRYSLATNVLERARDTQSQIGLTRHQRRENLRGAFRVKDREKLAGREVVLVDDVFTTGTTASECARVLRRAGAARVWIATVARTLKLEVQGVQIEPQEDDKSLTMAAHG
ncbi:MAG TPA: ComF family protein [Terriglobales bacterium]|nr:ComF family protein [Terriglobales bacterium]